MTETTSMEAELVKITKFKGAKYPKRQDYLAALLVAIDKLTNDDYDNLTDEAVAWHQRAVPAMEAKDPIPDFTETEEAETEEAESGDEHSGSEEVMAGEEEAGAPVEEEAATSSGQNDRSNGSGAEETGKTAKSKKKAKVAPTAKGTKITPDYTTLTGEKDRYGITIGTKSHEALKMYEKGTTGAQIMEALGGRHYNVLKKLMQDGHRVEKLENGFWRLTHKDDLPKAKKAKS